jgi:DNA-binding GntR family transcriptional regulator
MTQSEHRDSSTIDQVLAFIRNHPAEPIRPEEICERTGISTTKVREALETLANDGVIDRQHVASGRDEYIYRQQ